MKTKTVTTVEYPIDDFNKLVLNQLYPGRNAKLEYIIREVGGDPLDRFPGVRKVVSVQVVYDGHPSNRMTEDEAFRIAIGQQHD